MKIDYKILGQAIVDVLKPIITFLAYGGAFALYIGFWIVLCIIWAKSLGIGALMLLFFCTVAHLIVGMLVVDIAEAYTKRKNELERSQRELKY